MEQFHGMFNPIFNVWRSGLLSQSRKKWVGGKKLFGISFITLKHLFSVNIIIKQFNSLILTFGAAQYRDDRWWAECLQTALHGLAITGIHNKYYTVYTCTVHYTAVRYSMFYTFTCSRAHCSVRLLLCSVRQFALWATAWLSMQERLGGDPNSQLVSSPSQRLASSLLSHQPRRDPARPPLPPSRYNTALRSLITSPAEKGPRSPASPSLPWSTITNQCQPSSPWPLYGLNNQLSPTILSLTPPWSK